MPIKKTLPHDFREQAEEVKDAWEDMNEEEFGSVRKADFLQHLYEYDQIDDAVRKGTADLRALRGKRKDAGHIVWDEVIGVRDSVAGKYGRDSVTYQRVGRTRLSEYRPPKRDPKAKAKTATSTKTTDSSNTGETANNTPDTGGTTGDTDT